MCCCTWPFSVDPNVPRKLPSAPKNADITFSRSARLGSARYRLNPAVSSFTLLPSLSVTVGYGKSASDRMP
jgi:hypothetical protein